MRSPSPVLVGGAPLARWAAGWYLARSPESQSKPPVARMTAAAATVVSCSPCASSACPGRTAVSRTPARTWTPARTTPSSSPATSATPPVRIPVRSRSRSRSQSYRSG